jgi:hypothetical protein
MLVALAVLAARPEWLAVAAAAYPVYQAGHLGVDNSEMQQWAYLPAALVVVGVMVLRHRTRNSAGIEMEPAGVTCGHPAG